MNHFFYKAFLLFSLLSASNLKMNAQESNPNELEKNKQWFREAKFGMFIHWGVYSILGGEYKDKKLQNGVEWIQLHDKISNEEYEKVAKTFNPASFDADKWMILAKQAGMKYVVFTTKHHDGFCLFKSQYTNYNVVDFTPYKADIVKKVSDACQKNGIRLGLYYSIVDWHHPEFPAMYSQEPHFHGNPNPNADINKYADYEYNQLRELMSNYGPVYFAWFDAGGGFKDVDRFKLLKGDSVVKMIRKYQPACLINSRIGIDGDYGTPEQTIPGTIQNQSFEVCMTMNDNWGFAKSDNHWKSSKDLIRKLIDVAHKGGNFLLNVGPDGNGHIPDSAATHLKDMGKWLDKNGEAIYGTRNSLWESPSWGRSTTKFLDNGNTVLYFHIFNWPDKNLLSIPEVSDKKVVKAFVITDKGKRSLKTSRDNQNIIIDLSSVTPDDVATVVGLEVTGQQFRINQKK